MTGRTETQRTSLGKIVCIGGTGGAPDNALLVFFAEDPVTIRDVGTFAKRAGRERIAVCRIIFLHVSALLFLPL